MKCFIKYNKLDVWVLSNEYCYGLKYYGPIFVKCEMRMNNKDKSDISNLSYSRGGDCCLRNKVSYARFLQINYYSTLT